MKMIESMNNPYDKMKSLVSDPKFANFQIATLVYIMDISEMYPIDLNLEENINQLYVRLRPEFVKEYTEEGERVKIGGGALTY